MINILTTSTSLDKVSGIANVTRLWSEHNKYVNYTIFYVGRKERVKRNISWVWNQLFIPINYYFKIKKINPDIVHINMPLEKLAILRETILFEISVRLKRPVVLHIRGGQYNTKSDMPFIFRIMIAYCSSKASRIIVMSKIEQSFLSRTFGIDESNIAVIPNSVRIPSNINIKEIYAISKLNLLYIGRIDRKKGLLEILKALSLINGIDYTLYIAGDGHDKEWFLSMCKELIPGRYKYIGVQTGDKKDQIFRKCHIFLLPSYYEGLPNALLEAMSYGLVSIVTGVGSIPDLVKDDFNGIIVPLNSHNKIFEAIIRLHESHQHYKDISKASYDTIKKYYSLRNQMASINDVYKNILRSKSN